MTVDLALRARLVRAMKLELNIWTAEFGHVAGRLPAAVVDGRVPLDLIAEYPPYPAEPYTEANGYGYPVDLSQKIARLAGLDPDASAEDVGVVIHTLHAIRDGQASINDHDFSFYEETLDACRLTLDQVREFMGSLDLAGAVRLFADAAAMPLGVARGEEQLEIVVHWSEALGDGAAEALSYAEEYAVAGHWEWRLGAVYLYELPDGWSVEGPDFDVEFEPGTYLRTTHFNQVQAYKVSGQVWEYVGAIEQAWLDETDGSS